MFNIDEFAARLARLPENYGPTGIIEETERLIGRVKRAVSCGLRDAEVLETDNWKCPVVIARPGQRPISITLIPDAYQDRVHQYLKGIDVLLWSEYKFAANLIKFPEFDFDPENALIICEKITGRGGGDASTKVDYACAYRYSIRMPYHALCRNVRIYLKETAPVLPNGEVVEPTIRDYEQLGLFPYIHKNRSQLRLTQPWKSQF